MSTCVAVTAAGVVPPTIPSMLPVMLPVKGPANAVAVNVPASLKVAVEFCSSLPVEVLKRERAS